MPTREKAKNVDQIIVGVILSLITAVGGVGWYLYLDIKATQKDTSAALQVISTDLSTIKGSRFTSGDGIELRKGVTDLTERVARIEAQNIATTELVRAVNAQGEMLGGIKTDVEWIKRSFKEKQ